MTKESWKPIKGFEGFYEVSNLGRVKSLARVIFRENYRKQTFKERIRIQVKGKNGYLSVFLSKISFRKT